MSVLEKWGNIPSRKSKYPASCWRAGGGGGKRRHFFRRTVGKKRLSTGVSNFGYRAAQSCYLGFTKLKTKNDATIFQKLTSIKKLMVLEKTYYVVGYTKVDAAKRFWFDIEPLLAYTALRFAVCGLQHAT